MYSFNGGKEAVLSQYADELEEVYQVIASVNAEEYKTKISREKTMPGKLLYKPNTLNKAFKQKFEALQWDSGSRLQCDYPTEYYLHDYVSPVELKKAYREIDFLKNRLGVEIQFGKYSFMVYNVCAKMTIFHNEGFIDVGIEVVPLKGFASQMSTGVSYFEQIVWDLERRGVADIDIPVLILGITA